MIVKVRGDAMPIDGFLRVYGDDEAPNARGYLEMEGPASAFRFIERDFLGERADMVMVVEPERVKSTYYEQAM
jgi:hypothetical protein